MKSSTGARVVMLLTNPATYDERPLKEARALAVAGHRVTILAWDRESATKTDSVDSDGVVIKRFRLRAGHGTPFLTVPKLMLFYLWCLAHLTASKFEAVHCHDVDSLPVGLMVRTLKFGRPKLVYDLHDLPEAFLRFFPLSQTFQSLFLSVCRRSADLVVTASEGFTANLRSRGFKGARLVTVLNSPTLAAGRPPREVSGPLGVLYYGALEEERGVKLLVEAVEGLPDVNLTIAGRGALAGWVRSRASTNTRLRFLGWLGPKELSKVVREADLIPSLYRPKTLNIRLSTPGKLLASLSLSIPVLTSSGTHQAELVKMFNCGEAVEWGDVDGIAKALSDLKNRETRSAMSEAAYRAFREKLNWEIMEARLRDSYVRLLQSQVRASPSSEKP